MPDISHPMAATVDALFVGAVGTLGHDEAASAIDKHTVADARWLDAAGVAGDAVGDPVHHGGPDRALSHYPAEHYAHWQTRYPECRAAFVPGVLGENISTQGLTEADVRVGDVFRLGAAIIQITQPRQPCWKMDARLAIAGLARAVVDDGRAGWLYRVVEAGPIAAGQRLTLVAPAEHGITLATMWRLKACRQPDATQRRQLQTLAELPALAPDWRRRMARCAQAPPRAGQESAPQKSNGPPVSGDAGARAARGGSRRPRCRQNR